MRLSVRREDGITLIEILVSVSVMTIAFGALIMGFIAATVTSDLNRKQATDLIQLRTFAESVKSETYASCATTSSYGSGYSAPSGYGKSITLVQYYAASSSSPATGTFQGTCPATDQGLQRITLRVASNDGKAIETLVIVKRCTGARPAVCP